MHNPGPKLHACLDNSRRIAVIEQHSTVDPAILEEVRNLDQLPVTATSGKPSGEGTSSKEAKAGKADGQNLIDLSTQTYNIHAFLSELKAEIERCRRYKHAATVAIVYVDTLTGIREQLGPLAVDTILSAVVDMLKNSLRQSGICSRYDDNGFALLLPGAAACDAATMAQSVKQRIGTHAVTHNWRNIKITVSIGLASFPLHATEYAELVASAVTAARFAQSVGGDRVVIV